MNTDRPESTNIQDRRGNPPLTEDQLDNNSFNARFSEARPHTVWPDRIAEDKFAPLGDQLYSDSTEVKPTKREPYSTLGELLRMDLDVQDFVVDTFKRARTVGLPIHEFTKAYDPRQSDKFTKEEYDY